MLGEFVAEVERAVALLVAEAEAQTWSAREVAARQGDVQQAYRAAVRGALAALDAGNVGAAIERLEHAERVDREAWDAVPVEVAAAAFARL